MIKKFYPFEWFCTEIEYEFHRFPVPWRGSSSTSNPSTDDWPAPLEFQCSLSVLPGVPWVCLASHFWLFHVSSGNPASSEHIRLSASARSGGWHTLPSCRVKEVKSALSDQNQPPGGAQESPSPSPASSSRHRGWPLISNQEEHWFSENVRPCNHSPVAAWACLVWRLLH